MIRTFLFVSACVASLLAPEVHAQTTIERLAPENTVVVVGARNMQSTMDRAKATGLWNLWQSEQMQALRADVVKQMDEGMAEMLKELGVEEDSLVAPTGPVGFAVFTVMNEELGLPEAAMLLMADYGTEEHAEKTASLIQAALDRGQRDNRLTVDTQDVGGKTVHTIDLSKLDGEDADAPGADADAEMDEWAMDEEPNPLAVEKLHYVRSGNAFLASTDLAALTEALNAMDGQAGKSLADRADYQAVVSRVGENDVYGAVLTRDIMELAAAQDPMGMTQMIQPVLRALVGKVDGYGMGVRLDGPQGMLEQTIAVYMPGGKAGLTSLFDTPLPRAELPSFVSTEAVSYSAMNFEFGGLMGVIRNVVNSSPILAAQAGEQIAAIEPVITQLTSALGTQVHVYRTATQPFGATPSHAVTAIECTQPQEFENLFGNLAAGAGLEARDFLGQRIYSMNPDMMAMMGPGMDAIGPLSVGIGGGFVFIGGTPAVEQGLRATSEPGAPTVAGADEFQRAIATLSREGAVAWGYSDAIDAMEVTIAGQRQAMQKMVEGMREQDPQMAEEMEQSIRESMAVWDNMDFDLLRQHIGPYAWQIRSTDDGYIMNSYLLPAKE